MRKEIGREEKKSSESGEIQTHDLLIMRHSLYHCATTRKSMCFLLPKSTGGSKLWYN